MVVVDDDGGGVFFFSGVSPFRKCSSFGGTSC